MSDSTVELSNIDRPTRFHVNPVDRMSKEAAAEVYRKIVENDCEANECDTFPEEAANIVRRTRRLSSLKSSFRDKDKPPKYKDQQTTRFQVTQDDSESNSNDEDCEGLLDNEYDTRYGKSFRHFTREALPRLDNYRNILSIQAAHRPTLDELHNATMTNKVDRNLSRNADPESGMTTGIKFGWIQGVLIRCLLNIWGVMLFLRLSWVVGQSGVIEGIILILTATAVTTITSLSMSAISTNGVIKGGGTYYMISRSLGPEFGGSIGLIFSLANAVACAMYVVGFCESMNDLLASFGLSIIDGGVQDTRIIGTITILVLTVIVVVGMEWEAKAQNVLLVILLFAVGDYIVGALIGPKSDSDIAKGFVGFNATVFLDNCQRDYREVKGVQQNFFSVFAIFFPAATGILAGANISGDLKDPQKSIPKGTLLAILITTSTYIGMALIAGGVMVRDATGNIDDAVNGSLAFLDCANRTCAYGLQNSFQVIELVSAFGPAIYAGCFAATLSSALASLVSAPKVFQALCKDDLYPKIKWFARGYGKNNEPVRGYVLTFILATAFILIGKLDAIAPLISNFFLGAYMLINFSTFHASLAKPIGWRPTFKYYNMWLSLVGAILCVAVMFLIDLMTALLTYVAVIALYLIVAYRKPGKSFYASPGIFDLTDSVLDVNWGSTTQAQTYKNALVSVQQLNNVEEHVKNYRPQILVLTHLPNTRPILVDFAYSLTKNVSLLVCGHIVEGTNTQKQRIFLQHRAADWFEKHKVKGFYSLIDGENFESGARALMQATGVGKLKPNILLMGYKLNWRTCNRSELIQYFNTVHKALDMHLSVAILRVSKGLDYSQVLGEDVPISIFQLPKTIPSNDSSADLHGQDKSNIHGSCDSLSRNVSQADNFRRSVESNGGHVKASSTSDLSGNAVLSSTRDHVSGLPDPLENRTQYVVKKDPKKSKRRASDASFLYKAPGGVDLPKDVLQDLTLFTRKRSNAVIDVYWLYDDGGLTLLLPYIISTRRTWNSCKLRVFALANKQLELEFEMSAMASLLAKFRIDYSDLQLISDITKKPQESTVRFFKEMITEFMAEDKESIATISEADLLGVQDKTNRHLRLREYVLEKSSKSDLVVMTLPMPRKNIISAPLYMAWLECLSRGLPPFLFVRGNQTSVLTFYS
ncbi:Bumetanide-sensitive sodium-(potassium)-chloride cotransporter [Pseudolycoriella hygida]|uniref:Bumetanide-sensitive sodium-(Potassium)-chloride cotransporter n=1 Tax=Pseudolycoriella hygida TaxID=35572 RepID=A0A9Q0MPI7_9DIPT|nr:Bumetanide-sensitive sodium-(potassium)-chloride cotransporter [Pseudolycoriella hygida]